VLVLRAADSVINNNATKVLNTLSRIRQLLGIELCNTVQLGYSINAAVHQHTYIAPLRTVSTGAAKQTCCAVDPIRPPLLSAQHSAAHPPYMVDVYVYL
jgi:hypothetical protein